MKRKAKERIALAEAMRLVGKDGRDDLNAIDRLMDMLERAAQYVDGLERFITELVEAEGPQALTVKDRHGAPQPHWSLLELRIARDQVAAISAKCASAGIAERQTRITELQGRRMGQIMGAALSRLHAQGLLTVPADDPMVRQAVLAAMQQTREPIVNRNAIPATV